MKIGWTQNVIILEADLNMDERRWYLRATAQFGWSKAELKQKINSASHLEIDLDESENTCYTDPRNTNLEPITHEQDTLYLSRQDRNLTAETPDMSAFFGNDLCDLHHTYTKKLPSRSPDNKPQVGPVLPV